MRARHERIRHIFEDKSQEESRHYSKARAAFVLSAVSLSGCVLSVVGFLWLRARFSDADAIRAWVNDHLALGVLLMTCLCALQVVIAFVPGEIVEIAAGYAFGGLLGAVVCSVGITAGSIVAMLLARRFGRRLVESLYSKRSIDSLPILNDSKKRNAMVFLLFLIPGTPKDMMTYVVGMTGMSVPLYVLLTSFARFPSIIISTLGGGAIGEERLGHAALIFIFAGIFSVSGYLLYNSIKSRRRDVGTR